MSEAYIQRDNRPFEAHLEERTASRAAAFLLPHLRPEMRLLDIGCGPGTITLGLAERLTHGQVLGIDVQPAMVERARQLAATRGLTNVRFDVADVYDLPVADGSVDAALAHMVLMHLREPVRALGEVRRALVPGGVVGLRDADLATTVRSPSTPEWEHFLDLRRRAHELQGSDPSAARRHRQYLLSAGFARTEAQATTEGVAGSLAQAGRRASWLKAQLAGFARTAIAEGWIDQVGVDAIAADIDAWSLRPDGVFFTVVCETLGWV